MTSKRRLAQLQNARLASIAHFKKRELERTHRSNREQPRIDDNELSTNNTGDTDADTDEEGTWFWNQSANKLESDSKCDGYSDGEGSRTEEEAPSKATIGNKMEQRREGKFAWSVWAGLGRDSLSEKKAMNK